MEVISNMYVRTDNSNNIVELIFVGDIPTKNGYEVDETTIDREILEHAFEYKYIDGEFVKNEDYRLTKIDDIKQQKISFMNQTCNYSITKGIDYNGEHYSLTELDQINLARVEYSIKSNPDLPVLYKADGKNFREYTADEILELSSLVYRWVTYHRMYLNLVKEQISSMNNIDDIIIMKYGEPLIPQYQSQLSNIIPDNDPDLHIEIVADDFDYESFFRKIDIDSLMDTTSQPNIYPNSVGSEIADILPNMDMV